MVAIDNTGGDPRRVDRKSSEEKQNASDKQNGLSVFY
jgi:hypothetical protein